jgi:hypothetical protein
MVLSPSPVLKRLGREVDHLHTFKVKNEWSCTSTYPFMTWTGTTIAFYFNRLHSTISITFSCLLRHVNSITPSACTDTFKNVAFYPHCVCVCVCVWCVFPRVSQQKALIAANSSTWVVLALEKDCVLCAVRKRSLYRIWPKFCFQNIERLSVSPVDVTWLSEFWVSYVRIVTYIVFWAPHYNSIVN